MILQVMVAYDSKAHAYCKPFFVSHLDIGVRAFKEAANTPGHELYDHAEDFSLYHLGTWNDELARFLLATEPTQVAFAANLRERNVQPKVA